MNDINKRYQKNDPTFTVVGEVGDWMDLKGESIYGCGPAPFPKPEWGRLP